MIKAIIFDMGGVLIRFDREYFISRLGVREEDKRLLEREVFLSLEWAKMDRGSMTEQDASASICKRLPGRLHEAAEKLVTMWERPILPIEGMEELIRNLKENGYHIYLLSNASVRQHEYWPSVPASSFFEDTLISADVGFVTPQPEIFRLALEKFGILSEESVFIDDLPLNAEGADYVGMKAIVFHQDMQELRGKLAKLGVNAE